MSRSNPTENASNPAVRWFEWNGENGVVRYYDKEAKKNVDVGSDFTFILLDQLATVRGWHDASSSGIYANEVRDTRQDAMVVKAFKGGTLAEGIYANIKDRINSLGGQFVANCYIAFKNGGGKLAIGSLRFKGSALGSWMDFCKANRTDLYRKAIRINGFTEGKKGRITFRMPVLSLMDLSADSDKQAIALDVQLQEFLKSYFTRTTRERVDTHDTHVEIPAEDVPNDSEMDEYDANVPAITADDIPF